MRPRSRDGLAGLLRRRLRVYALTLGDEAALRGRSLFMRRPEILRPLSKAPIQELKASTRLAMTHVCLQPSWSLSAKTVGCLLSFEAKPRSNSLLLSPVTQVCPQE